jgi:hypothetical protein
MEDQVVVRLQVHSNYDCTNSSDTLQSSDYLRGVYQAVKAGVTKAAMMEEHRNGAYGGALFCFVFKMPRAKYEELDRAIAAGRQILIPKGTQFGFHSSFQGASSPFEHETRRDIRIASPYGGTEYDSLAAVLDIGNTMYDWSIDSVFGTTSFIHAAGVRPA